MSALVWILTWLPLVLPAVSELPKPINVTTTSTRWGYNLSWEPGPGTPTGTSYSVSVQTDRSLQNPVTGCQHVQNPRICNLTEAFTELWVKYDIRVAAQLEAQRSQPAEVQYKPIDHLELPELTVAPCSRDLCVDLQPPHQHLQQVYDGLDYQLHVSSGAVGRSEYLQVFKSLKTQVLTNLLPGREYCVSVRFSENEEKKEPNFGRPVCVSTLSTFSADLLISVILSLLVVFGLVVLVLLGGAGFFCLNCSPMPPILTSIHHLEEVLVRASSSSLMNVKLVAPPAGGKSGSQSSSEDSDEDCETSCRSSSGGGGGYTHRVGTNLHSSSSSSSLSSSSSVSSRQKAETGSCSRTSDGSNLLPPSITEPQSRTEPSTPSSEGLTPGRTEEEDPEVGGSAGQGVNLLTLTFGRQEQEQQQEEEDAPDPSEGSSVPPVPPVLPSPWTAGDEEEPDDTCGYMGRPSADVLQNLLSNTC